jgi:hypothetical protein
MYMGCMHRAFGMQRTRTGRPVPAVCLGILAGWGAGLLHNLFSNFQKISRRFIEIAQSAIEIARNFCGG